MKDPDRGVVVGRQISYAAAIQEATDQAMSISADVIVLGQLSDLPSGIFGTTTGLVEKLAGIEFTIFLLPKIL